MKIEFFIPIIPQKQHSFWFYGIEIISIFSKNNNYIKIVPLGEIIVEFPECKGQYYKGSNTVKFAFQNNYIDKDINELFNKELFDYSNWFQLFFKREKDTQWKEIVDSPIYSTIKESTIAAERYVNNDDFWDNLEKYCY